MKATVDRGSRSRRIPAGRITIGNEPAVVGCVSKPAVQGIRVTPRIVDGVVRSLRIECACGQATEVDCLYEEEPR